MLATTGATIAQASRRRCHPGRALGRRLAKSSHDRREEGLLLLVVVLAS